MGNIQGNTDEPPFELLRLPEGVNAPKGPEKRALGEILRNRIVSNLSPNQAIEIPLMITDEPSESIPPSPLSSPHQLAIRRDFLASGWGLCGRKSAAVEHDGLPKGKKNGGEDEDLRVNTCLPVGPQGEIFRPEGVEYGRSKGGSMPKVRR